ncbi:MAG TPA: carboxylating nicotinate-nucleotide diphosphorylase [Actinomycetota bacterium]
MKPDPAVVEEAVRRALAEDVGSGDVTTDSIVEVHGAGIGILEARQDCVIAGVNAARETFRQIGGCDLPGDLADGDRLKDGDRVPLVIGSLRSILTGERVALNFLQRLSGIATLTRRFADAAPNTQIRDTRKTTPGMRALEKAAVAVGGGVNHRFGLYDAILIKDNHIAVAGSVKEAMVRARRSGMTVQVECDTIGHVREALAEGVEAILLDNMTPEEMREAVAIIDCAAFVEASGGITLDTVAAVAATGVDAISVGALTHSAPAIDLSLDVRPE